MDKEIDRIEKLIVSFKRELCKKGFDRICDCLVYPGEILLVNRKSLPDKDMDNANAYIEKVDLSKIPDASEKGDHPYWIIYLIKEELVKMSDKDVLHLLAHEASHILMSCEARFYSDLHILSEQACDVLAEKFLGFPKKDRRQGYIH